MIAYRSFVYLFLSMLNFIVFSSVALAQEGNSYTVESQYLTMRDDVQIATYTLLPINRGEDQLLPTILRSSRYLIAIQNLELEETLSSDDLSFLEAGYAVVLVSARGSGVSGGNRPIEWSPDEVADLGEVVDWIIGQSWSNGRVGSYGVSYDGNTAELLTVPNHPAVRIVAPLYSDFDPFGQLAMPGGIFNQRFIELWNAGNQAMDQNDICFLAEIEDEDQCEFVQTLFPSARWMDEDSDGSTATRNIENRDNVDVYEALQELTYRDDPFGQSGLTLSDVSPYGLRDAIQSSDVPMVIWVSWLDAGTVDGALARYQTLDNPQHLVIGAWNHGGEYDTDPFNAADTPPTPDFETQFEMRLAFFDQFLRDDPATSFDKSITYYTMNANTWTTTDVFPPEGFETLRWYFAEDNMLLPEAPVQNTGNDVYTVNFDTSTGTDNRWMTQLGGSDVIYPNRAEQDELLLTYTTAPFETDVEITGHPIVTLQVASTHADGAFYVYLEDVAPDGTVTYITEGQLRAIHHPIGESALYENSGVFHSLNRNDAKPLVPGEVTEIRLNLYATSVFIEAGHRLRVAIAGHDASMFERYPADGTPVLTFERNAINASYIDLPVQTR